MAVVTSKQAKALVLAAWADDEWWGGAPIATGAVTDLGDAWLIEVGVRAYLVDGDDGSMMPDSPTALVTKADGAIRSLAWIEAMALDRKARGLPAD